MNNADRAMLIVDAHVHVYDCFELDTLLASASGNFTRVAAARGLTSAQWNGVLLLTETRSENWFRQVRDASSLDHNTIQPGNHWQFKQSPDSFVLYASKSIPDSDDELRLLIVAGRQIVTAEGLEILALATDSQFEDRLPAAEVLARVRAQDAIPVLPWAVGKWLGKRGKLVSALLDSEENTDLCLGDNGGRPVFWRNPSHFHQGRTKHFNLLPGTDPLPFCEEVYRVGSFGFTVPGRLSEQQPGTDMKRILRDKSSQINPFGRLESSFRFFANQLKLRVVKP